MKGRNIEIKARVSDMKSVAEKAEAIADSGPVVLYQRDTFFNLPESDDLPGPRLKLRRFSEGSGELISYVRAEGARPRGSDYSICPVDDPDLLSLTLSSVLGTIGTVTKKRVLFISGQTRVHLDEVDGLGDFLELEVVLRDGQPDSEGVAEAGRLMEILGIGSEDLCDKAYIDMITRQG